MIANQGYVFKSYVANLNQAAAAYDLTGAATGGDVMIFPALSAYYVDTTAVAPLTSVKIHTDATTPSIMLTTTEGDVAKLLTGVNLTAAWVQPIVLKSGGKIKFTIAGGAGGAGAQMTVTLAFRPASSLGGTI